jgi:nucleotide-binding universal stress UspA family protein
VARGGAAQAVLARAARSSLVVMGRRDEDDQPGWLGSVSRKVVERASAPVAVVPPEWEGRDLERIAVGVDFSEPSALAVRWACDLAGVAGGRVLAIHAVAPASPGAGGADDEELAARTLAFCAEHGPEGVAVEAVTDRRPPARAVTEVAEEQGADLVVVGRRGSGGLPRTILGSVAAYAARYATCPVVVVPS